ncbi:hypothetical protein BJ741DRAFT_195930 [Chytriomyces cf. hyalinus JEL632]|nr:hypothetical protein BJ741DRAFT_195930 [Chytriomyces cf. hyalinus JEL632]
MTASNPTLRKKYICYGVTALLFLAAIISCLTAVAVVARKKSESKNDYYVESPATNVTPQIVVQVDTESVDVMGGHMRCLCLFFLADDLIAPGSEEKLYPEPKSAISVTIGPKQFSFKANQPMLWQSVNIPVFGDFNFYPFDTLESIITVSATAGDNTTLPVSLILTGIPNGYNFRYTADTPDGFEAVGKADIERNVTVRSFATLIMVIMWFLALASVTFAAGLQFYGKKVEPPFVAFTIALLFAMPGIRNTMPSAPPIGCLADQMVLVWVMVILALCVLYYFVRLIMNIIPEKTAYAPVQA